MEIVPLRGFFDMDQVLQSNRVFSRALAQPRNLLLIHKELGTDPPQRYRKQALTRGAVVFSVAAWQSLVQGLTRAAIDGLKPNEPQPLVGSDSNAAAYALYRSRMQAWKLHRGTVLNKIATYNTPSAENTRELLQLVGVDVQPYWTWQLGQKSLTFRDVTTRLNSWLRARHALAHGDARLPDETVLSTSRTGRMLRLRNAEECIAFFEGLGHQTIEAVFEPGEPQILQGEIYGVIAITLPRLV